ncbi:YggS family pyridoxal phosphate-dependent enzyme [Actinoalloteichus hymeniacidonis]|uniref:Pyridoxal phosphate homeostasis protein n=1 Tax=Actinoalloteichus hymeniacidonis TaxID=340345 RepID=A0AAC9HP10_9PSEU|nr:YggS family pyridoxal phosphate-dependent enzyme [Actinoalloteichus hymeniacidonis]AOS62723.1 pyridoxal phosphate enzyme, YggS family [Actinoalloteichus hymeniacidonis]MBB5909246.1 hypothetical protein [Actinoalloteichus hymeniacidonis]
MTETDFSGADSRREFLADRLGGVRERIAAACAAADRASDSVRLLAVTKTFPASDVALLGDLGLTEFGENRAQDASVKAAEVAAMRPGRAVRWHMVGSVQRNKARGVARWADVVESVDSPRLAEALAKGSAAARAAGERESRLDVMVQVSLDGAAGRGGCSPDEVPQLAEVIGQSSELRLIGVMAVAPLTGDPQRSFETLRTVSDLLKRDHRDAVEISAGMSNDLERAIAAGSTSVRVGTALLGTRPIA